jgi:hypothetical protein
MRYPNTDGEAFLILSMKLCVRASTANTVFTASSKLDAEGTSDPSCAPPSPFRAGTVTDTLLKTRIVRVGGEISCDSIVVEYSILVFSGSTSSSCSDTASSRAMLSTAMPAKSSDLFMKVTARSNGVACIPIVTGPAVGAAERVGDMVGNDVGERDGEPDGR